MSTRWDGMTWGIMTVAVVTPSLFHATPSYACAILAVLLQLVQENYAVFSMDHQGHGRSEGPRCQLENYHTYYEDMHQFIALVCVMCGEHLFFDMGRMCTDLCHWLLGAT